MERTWISPAGEVHQVCDASLYAFCTNRGLHYENMLDHIARSTSDQKNGGWRLIERLKAIGHVERPNEHVLVIGTVEDFHDDCLRAKDGRDVLKDRRNLAKLIGGHYKGGKPWKQWEHRHLSNAEKLRLLQHLHMESELPAAAEPVVSVQVALPDYGAAGLMAAQWSGAAASSSEQISRLGGSLEVRFRCAKPFSPRPTRWS